MLHTFVALVEDKTGLLARVTSLFRRLNVNIISLTVGGTETVGVLTRTTIVAKRRRSCARIMASLYKLEGVLDVDDVGRHCRRHSWAGNVESRGRPKHSLSI